MFAGGSTYSGASSAGSAGGGGGSGGNSGSGNGGASGAHDGAPSYANAMAEANDLDALVFEFGTAKCKFGFAGEDFPRVYESPLSAEHDQNARGYARHAAQMETDYEAIAQWLFDAASSRLQTRMSDHPLLVVERPFAIPDEFTKPTATATATATVTGSGSGEKPPGSKSDENKESSSNTTTTTTTLKKRDFKARERMVEVLMESMDLPALFCAKSSVLACYANARTSGLVVEMGATYTSITSVHEGYAFAYPKSQVFLYGGYDLDAFLRSRLDPQLSAIASPSSASSSSFSPWAFATEAKESGLCRVADGPFDEAQNAQLPKISYELPDKTIVQLGTERFSVGEQFFVPPSTISSSSSSSETEATPVEIVSEFVDTDAATKKYGIKKGLSLPELICETGAMTTEAELRKELFQNLVLTGGSSCFENLPTRLEREIVMALSSSSSSSNNATATNGFAMAPGFGSTRIKMVAAQAQERRIGSFLGGSILASLGSFHEMWMSKAEYAEHGATLIHKKCP